MKRVCRPVYCVLLFLMVCFTMPSVSHAGETGRQRTIMVYMCGSNLESSYGSASADMQEMLDADYDTASTTVLLMTGGSSFWFSGYPADKTSIVELGKKRTRVVWSDDALDMGEPETLTRFLQYGMETCPAEEYALVLWNHGGGPLEGVCWDELFSMDSLSLSELTSALEQAGLPGKLSWIGFDACLMGCAEVASAVSPYADYMIASQETEPAKGWNYSFLNGIEKDRSGAETGRRIVDSYFGAFSDSSETLTMACIDLSGLDLVQKNLDSFFAPIEEDLDKESFAAVSELRFSSTSFGRSVRGIGDNSYDLVDLTDLVEHYSKNNNASRVVSAVKDAVLYSRSTIEGASGLSVYHPFSNKQKYLDKWKEEYKDFSFSAGYEEYLEKFGSLLTGETMASWAGLGTEEKSADQPDETVFSLQLTPEQQEAFTEAQLLILAARDTENGVYGVQVSREESGHTNQTFYSPVAVTDTVLDENGELTAKYSGRTLYVTDGNGTPLQGPLAYRLSEDGKTFYIHGRYEDASGRENAADNLPVLFESVLEEDGHTLQVLRTQAYDPASDTYTSRIPVDEREYTRLFFYSDLREMPADGEELPGFEAWEDREGTGAAGRQTIRLPLQWKLCFFDTQLSAAQLYASFQVTDSQQNTHSSIPVPVSNPNLEDIVLSPRVQEDDTHRLKVYLIRDASPMSPGVNLLVELTNLSRWNASFEFRDLLLNREQSAVTSSSPIPIYLTDLAPGETRVDSFHIEQTALTGLERITEISMTENAYFTNHSGSNFTRDLLYTSDNCELTGIAPQCKEPIAETEHNGSVWQLLSMEENAYGEMTGVFCVQNNEDSEIYGYAFPAVNGVTLTSGMNMTAAPLSRAYYSFTIRDEVSAISGLKVDGKNTWYLSEDHLLERMGVTAVETLTILQTFAYKVSDAVTFTLEKPLQLGTTTGPQKQQPGDLLVSGDVEIRAERILLADDGVGLRLSVRNHTDRIISVMAGEYTLNGKKTGDYADHFCVAENGSMVFSIDLNGREILEEGEMIRDAGIVFRIDDEFSAPEVHISLRTPGDGSRYLAPEYYDIVPVEFYRPVCSFLSPDLEEEGQYAVHFEGEFINGSQKIFGDDLMDPSQNFLQLGIELTNLTEKPYWYSFSNLVFNGQRVSDQNWYINEVGPGQTKSFSVRVSMEQLRGLREIHEIRCEMEYFISGDYQNTHYKTIRLETAPVSVAELVPEETPPLASGVDDGLLWELLEISEKEDGTIQLLLHGKNQSEEQIRRNMVDITADGIWIGRTWMDDYVLEPGMDFLMEFEASNQILVPVYEVEVYGYPYDREKNTFLLEDHCLERRGVQEISELRIYTDISYVTMETENLAILNLKDPCPLSDVPPDVSEGRFALLTGGPELYVNSVLVGDNGVSLELEVVNDTDRPVVFEPEDPYLNGTACRIYGSYPSLQVPPESTLATHLSIQIEDEKGSLVPGETIRDISMTWKLGMENEKTYSFETTFSLLQEAPLGSPGGVVVPGEKLLNNLSRVRLLMYTTPQMETDLAHRVQLIPALDSGQVADFKEGTASVYRARDDAYLVQDDDTDGDYIWVSALERLCTTNLEKDEDGVVSAGYSGLVWVNSQQQPLESVEYPAGNDTDDVIAVLQMALYRDMKDFQSLTEDIPLDESSFDYYMVSACLISTDDDIPRIDGSLTEIYSPDGEEITDKVIEEEAVRTAAAERQVRMRKDGRTVRTIYEKYPVVSQQDLMFVRADELEGELYVLYEIMYQDGTKESYLESYPYT